MLLFEYIPSECAWPHAGALTQQGNASAPAYRRGASFPPLGSMILSCCFQNLFAQHLDFKSTTTYSPSSIKTLSCCIYRNRLRNKSTGQRPFCVDYRHAR